VVRRIDFPKVDKPPFSLAESYQNSPRRSHLARAGDDTLPRCEQSYFLALRYRTLTVVSLSIADRNRGSTKQLETSLEEDEEEQEEGEIDSSLNTQPLPLLLQTFGSYLTLTPTFNPQQFLKTLTPYFSPYPISPNQTIFKQNDIPDGLYLIERGSLRATYAYDDRRELIQETMVAGTIAGDLSTLSETPRNCTVVSEGEGMLWKMDGEGLKRLEREDAEVARVFIRVVLKGELSYLTQRRGHS
jgi:SulP family sulfate permease